MNLINTRNFWGFLSTILFALCNYVKMEDCSQDELYKCTKSVSIVSEMSNDIALRTKADLNRICPDLQAGLECIRSYTRRCMDPERRQTFNQLYHGTGELIHQLCEDPIYQEDFLRHIPCMIAVRRANEDCAHKYQNTLEDITKRHNTTTSLPTNNHSSKEVTSEICCAVGKYNACINSNVKSTCGKEAVAFFQDFSKKSWASLHRHCNDYRPNPGKCGTPYYSSASKLFKTSTTNRLLVTILTTAVTIYLIPNAMRF